MAGVIYALCALTALLCAWQLLRAYRRSRNQLLLWGGLCFAGLTMNNLLLVVDRFLVPYVDLTTWRLVLALCSLLVMLYGLIWETE